MFARQALYLLLYSAFRDTINNIKFLNTFNFLILESASNYIQNLITLLTFCQMSFFKVFPLTIKQFTLIEKYLE
jgi:hypothetical protein